MEMGTKKNMRMLREAWAESNPAHCNERRRGKTRRGDTKHGFCVNRGWRWNRIMSANKGWNRIMSVMRGVQVRRCKNPPQGENLDRPKTKQTVQLRTSKIHKTRRQAGGFNPHYIKLCVLHNFTIKKLNFVVSLWSARGRRERGHWWPRNRNNPGGCEPCLKVFENSVLWRLVTVLCCFTTFYPVLPYDEVQYMFDCMLFIYFFHVDSFWFILLHMQWSVMAWFGVEEVGLQVRRQSRSPCWGPTCYFQ